MIGLENATEQGSLLPYVTGGTHGMLAYAQTEEACIRGVWNHFMEYLPYILLLQTLSEHLFLFRSNLNAKICDCKMQQKFLLKIPPKNINLI